MEQKTDLRGFLHIAGKRIVGFFAYPRKNHQFTIVSWLSATDPFYQMVGSEVARISGSQVTRRRPCAQAVAAMIRSGMSGTQARGI
jgi:hypothetical protein